MGIAERKQREKQEMRDLILEAATEMFISEGFEKTSIRNIAESIEYSPATIYLYFADKDELFHAIHESGFRMLIDSFQSVSSIADPVERLAALGRVYIRFGIQNPEFYDLMFIMRAPISTIERAGEWKCGMEAFEFLHAIIRECLEQDLLNVDDQPSPAISMMVWSVVHGLVSLHVRQRMKIVGMKYQRHQNDDTPTSERVDLPTTDEEVEGLLFGTVDMFVNALRKRKRSG